MTEAEKLILDFVRSGYFCIRDDGTIWRMLLHTRTGNFLSITPTQVFNPGRGGYLRAYVTYKGKRYQAMCHRIIWMASHGPLRVDLEINHIDNNRQNNRLSNLEPLTHGDNIAYSYKTRRRSSSGEANANSKLTVSQVEEIRSQKGNGPAYAVGKRFGVSHFTVQRIWNGSGWKEQPDVTRAALMPDLGRAR